MPSINFASREISCKIVYYGPGLSGKTTNLEVVHKRAPSDRRGPLTNIATEGDRTLFFDYMPLTLGKLNNMTTRFQLYTVPGQAYYASTRRLVLRGADGVVFVADSQRSMLEENRVALQDLEANLREQGLELKDMPLVIQWNKRDLPSAMPVEELEAELNQYGAPTVEAAAVTATGVFPTLRKIAHLVLEDLGRKFFVKTTASADEVARRCPSPTPEGGSDVGEDGRGAPLDGPTGRAATPPRAAVAPQRVAPELTAVATADADGAAPAGDASSSHPAATAVDGASSGAVRRPVVDVVAVAPAAPSRRRAWLLLLLMTALLIWAALGPWAAWLVARIGGR